MFGLSPYLLLGALVGSLALGAGGYIKGRVDGNAVTAASFQTQIAGMREKAEQEKQAELIAASNASTTLEQKNAEARVVYRTITETVDRIVDRPVYSNVCLDADGLQLVQDALAGVPAASAPSQPDAAVPDAHSAQ